MNKITKKGILATQALETYKSQLVDEQVLEEVLKEIKPSRMKTRKNHDHNHQKRKHFDDRDD